MRFALRPPPYQFLTRVSLRACLVAILLAAVCVLFIDRGREAARTRAQEIENTYTHLTSAARAGAEQQASLIAQAKSILQLVADLPITAPNAGAACHEVFRRLDAESDWLTSLFVYDLEGFPRCTSADRLDARSYADRPYFKEALARRDFAVSGYLVGRFSGRPILVVAYPRIAAGAPEAVVGAAIDLASMGDIAARVGAAQGAEVLLVDRDLTVLAAFPESTWVGRNLANEPNFATALASASHATATLDGRARLIGHVELPQTGATLAVMLPLDEVLRDANRQALSEFTTIVIGGVLLLAAIWLGGEFLVMRPLMSLTRNAAVIGAGDLGVRMQTDHLAPELRRLGESFNRMAEQLQDREAKLREANQRLAGLASRDPLTGVANRRAFDERIASEWSRAHRNAESLALLAVDVDHFKSFNDTYGHLEGDRCLRQVADVLERCARRGGDFAARIGGEEFALILPKTGQHAAEAMAERIRTEIESLAIEHSGSDAGRLTISVGVAAATAALSAAGPHALIDEADAALYRAKRAGRNRVWIAQSGMSLAS